MCNVTIGELTVLESDGTDVQRFQITGSVTDCEENPPSPDRPPHEAIVDITVTVVSTGEQEGQTAMLTASASTQLASGPWLFKSKALKSVPCGSTIHVKASCRSDPACSAERDFDLECEGGCPTVDIRVVEVLKCDGNQRTVRFEVAYQNAPDPTVLQISYGDSQNEVADVVSGSDTIQHAHAYDPGEYTATVAVSYPGNCADRSVEVDVPECEQDCAGIEDLQFVVLDSTGSPVNYNDCLQAGNYRIRVTAPTGSDLEFTWNGGEVANSPNERRVILTSGDAQTVSFVITSDACDPIPGAVTLRECDEDSPRCPSIGFSEIEVGDCVKGKRTVSVHSTVELGANAPVEATLSIRNATTEVYSESANSANGTVVLATNSLSLPPGDYTAFVTVDTPDDCPGASTAFEIDECGGSPKDPKDTKDPEDPDPPPPNGGVCDPCCIWFVVNLILTVAAVIAIIVAGCGFQWAEPISTGIAIGLAVAAAISWLLWAIFCAFLKPPLISANCGMLLGAIEILDWAEFASGIIAAILAFTGQLPCALAFAIDWILLGSVRRLLVKVAQVLGCQPGPFGP